MDRGGSHFGLVDCLGSGNVDNKLQGSIGAIAIAIGVVVAGGKVFGQTNHVWSYEEIAALAG